MSIISALSEYELVLLVWAIVSFFARVFFRFFYFSSELVYSGATVEFGFFIGLTYGLLNKYDNLILKENVDKDRNK